MARPADYKDGVYKFAERLKGWRESAHLSQKDLAQVLGVTQQTVSDWERGKILPASSRTTALEQAFGLPPQTVLFALFEEFQPLNAVVVTRPEDDHVSGVPETDIELLVSPHHGSVNDRLAALEDAAARQEAVLDQILSELRSLRGSR